MCLQTCQFHVVCIRVFVRFDDWPQPQRGDDDFMAHIDAA